MSKETGFLRGIFGWGSGTPIPQKTVHDDLIVGLKSGQSSIETTYYEKMKLPYTREEMYRLYDELDEMGEISGPLTAYAEDATQVDLERQVPVWVLSNNERVKKEVERCFFENIDVPEWLLPATRETGKYGDEFGRLAGKPGVGVTAVSDWPFPYNIQRLERKDTGVLLGFLDATGKDTGYAHPAAALKERLIKPWEMIHFRLKMHNRMPKNDERWVYGTSLLFSVRRSGRRLYMYSDLLFLYRLTNSFDRKVFYIDVGTEDLINSIKILKKWRRSLKKDQYINFTGSQYRITQNPDSLGEEIFWPRRENSNSAVDIIQGSANVADMADIDREENALFAGLRAPKEYFGFGQDPGGFDRDKSLSQKDIRWGRSVMALQNAMRTGLHRIGSIHLAYMGIDPKDPKNDFQVMMVRPSTLELIQNLDAQNELASLAQNFYSVGEDMGISSERWRDITLAKFFGYSVKEIELLTQDSSENALEGDTKRAFTDLVERVRSVPSYRHIKRAALRDALPVNGLGDGGEFSLLTEWLNTESGKQVAKSLVSREKEDTQKKVLDKA